MDAKGRNGYFKVAAWDAILLPSTGEIHVEMYSKRMGDTAPLRIVGSPDEIAAFAEGLLRVARAEVK